MKRPGLSWLIISVPLPLADVPSSPELDTVIEIRINAGYVFRYIIGNSVCLP